MREGRYVYVSVVADIVGVVLAAGPAGTAFVSDSLAAVAAFQIGGRRCRRAASTARGYYHVARKNLARPGPIPGLTFTMQKEAGDCR